MLNRNDKLLLRQIQREAIAYFLNEVNEDNGLIPDSTRKGSKASIAAVGLGLSIYPIAVERRSFARRAAIRRTLATLRFFVESPQSKAKDATGYKGFYYHFLDMKTGRRAGNCELSTIDTAIFIAGALSAAAYFDRDTADEREIRLLADELYRRVDWRWMLTPAKTVSHGWTPERGFLPYAWEGYNEAHILYVLGLGSPTHPLPKSSYRAWTRTFEWKSVFDFEYFYAGPLFIHQLSQCWLDLRKIDDGRIRRHGIDYFENSRRATYAQQTYAIRNPLDFKQYNEVSWGITASDGPGPSRRKLGKRTLRFYDYIARGIPRGPDDGTLAPWVVCSALPFAPEIVLPTIRHFRDLHLHARNPYGFKATFNATYPHKKGSVGWISPDHLGLNEGPVVIMIENFLTGFSWRLSRRCDAFVRGLERAEFAPQLHRDS